MPTSARSLWPEKLGAKPLPAPARILREQGEALRDLTQDRLYGEVLQSALPSVSQFTYDFYVGVNGKPYRHKLLSVKLGLLLDYPVTIENHEAETTVTVPSEEAFLEEMRQILKSDVTQELIGRLLTVAGLSTH